MLSQSRRVFSSNVAQNEVDIRALSRSYPKHSICMAKRLLATCTKRRSIGSCGSHSVFEEIFSKRSAQCLRSCHPRMSMLGLFMRHFAGILRVAKLAFRNADLATSGNSGTKISQTTNKLNKKQLPAGQAGGGSAAGRRGAVFY